jgi:hypothetical protein
MAKKELAKFCSEYLAAHPEVGTSLNRIADHKQFAKALVAAGSKAGFAFTESEILEVMGSGRELTDDQLEAVAGGRKAGGDPIEYLKIKLTDVLISG